jgi:hypothetical protein
VANTLVKTTNVLARGAKPLSVIASKSTESPIEARAVQRENLLIGARYPVI